MHPHKKPDCSQTIETENKSFIFSILADVPYPLFTNQIFETAKAKGFAGDYMDVSSILHAIEAEGLIHMEKYGWELC